MSDDEDEGLGHSWAWIAPGGRFHDIEDHGMWALDQPGVRRRAVGLMVEDLKEGRHDYDPFGPTPKIDYRNPPLYVSQILDILSTKEVDGWDVPPPKSHRPDKIITIYEIRPEVLKSPEVQRLMRKTTIFGEGIWNSGSKFKSIDNDFFYQMEDSFGEGTWYTEKKIEKPSHGEAVRKALWQKYVYLFIHNSRTWANHVLLSDGWMKAANPAALEVEDENDVDQWNSFFKHGYEILKKKYRDPSEVEFYGEVKERRVPERTWGDALERYADRDVSEAIFDDMLAKVSRQKMAGRCVESHSWGWINPNGNFHEIPPHMSHASWALEYPGMRERVTERLRQLRSWDDFLIPGSERLRDHTLAPSMPPLVFEAMMDALKTKSVWRPSDQSERFNFKNVWDYLEGSVNLGGQAVADSLLIKDGWAAVSNTNTINIPDEHNQDQWDTFFKLTYECIKGQRDLMDIMFFGYTKDKRLPPRSWGDALDRYASRKISEEIYDDLLDQVSQRS